MFGRNSQSINKKLLRRKWKARPLVADENRVMGPSPPNSDWLVSTNPDGSPVWSCYHGMDLALPHIKAVTDGQDKEKFQADVAMAIIVGPRSYADFVTQHVDAWNIFTALLLTTSIPAALTIPENILELDDENGWKKGYQWCIHLSIGFHMFTLMYGNNIGNMLHLAGRDCDIILQIQLLCKAVSNFWPFRL